MSWNIFKPFRRKPESQKPPAGDGIDKSVDKTELPREQPSMNETETVDFLRENRIRPLLDDWQPGQPFSFLYVLPEIHRNFYMPNLDKRPVNKVASIARLSNVTDLHLYSDGELGNVNKNGIKVDYYAIDMTTRKPHLVGTSHPKDNNSPFVVEKQNLFEADDDLFPESQD